MIPASQEGFAPAAPALPDGYSICAIGTGGLRLSHAGPDGLAAPLVTVKLPPDEAGRERVRSRLARAAQHRERMIRLRSEAIVAVRRGDLARERELSEAACHARESYDVAIANALGRYSK